MILQIPTTILDSETMQILAQNNDALGSMQFTLYLSGVTNALLVVAIMVIIMRSMKKISTMSETVIENKVKREADKEAFNTYVKRIDKLVEKLNEIPQLIITVQGHTEDIAQIRQQQSNLENKYPI